MASLVIESGRSGSLYWHDLWRYRELFYVLAWRDLAVKYRQTAVGVIWALIPPFINMIVFTVVFGHVAKMSSDGVPYPIFSFAGILPWTFFAAALSGSSQSLVSNSSLISKVYFPRMIIPVSSIVITFVDLLISFSLMVATMVWYRFSPNWHLIALPAMILLAFAAALGPGLLITALNVRFRDFRFIVTLALQIGAFVSPVGYSSLEILHKYPSFYPIYCLNPMVSVIDGFRWALLGDNVRIDPLGFTISVSVTVLLLFVGVWYFRKTERSFADLI